MRKVIHSGRITFRVLDELHSAFCRITFRGHGELHSALPSGAAASSGGQRLNLGPADYNSSPAGIADGNAVRWHSPDVLESADQPGHEPSALTKVGYSVRPGPRVSQPPGQPERHWSANHVHAELSRPAGPARKQAAAKGRPVVSVPEGSRPRAGQVTPACPWAGAATHKHADTIQLVVRPESRVGASAATACPVASACSWGGTYSGTNEAQEPIRPVSPTTTAASCDGACAQITNERSVRSG